MQPQLVLLGLASLLACAAAADFVQTGECEHGNTEYSYNYKVTEMSLEGSTEDTVTISCMVIITCEAAGTFGGKNSWLYNMNLTDIQISDGDSSEAQDSDEEDDVAEEEGEEESDDDTAVAFQDMLNGWFKFVQTEDGSIPAVFHPDAEDNNAVNFKKAIASAFQANFKGTPTTVEADTQSLHTSEYTYEASAQDKAEGTVKMHRRVVSNDVEDYASHIPPDVVDLDKEEDLVYKKGVLASANGVADVKMLPEGESDDDDIEGDTLEGDMGSRKKRDIDMSEFFDFLSTAQTEDNGEEEEDEDTPMPTGPPTDDGSDDMKYVYGDDYAAVEEDLANLDEADYAVMEGEEEEEEGGDEGEQEDDQSSYDENSDLPDFTAKGSYSMELAGQRKLTGRERRAVVNHLELPGATQGTLMAHVDHTHDDMVRMTELRSQLKDISRALDEIHRDPNGTSTIVNDMVELISLESIYGSVSGYTPAINTVIAYLPKLVGSLDERDCQMRALIYLMLSRDGGTDSQKTLVAALDTAVNEDEENTIVVYIAFTHQPQPQMISELEERIGSNIHSTHPLLLAYGALVARASPELQQRMTLFLLKRLPLAKTNTSSLIHHIFSLGNTESQLTTDSIVDYLHHPDEHVQMSSIHALRYATGDRLVQKTLNALVSQSNVSDDHLSAVLHCLLSGVEHASNTHTQPPFNLDLAMSLASSVMTSGEGELYELLMSYLQQVRSEDARNLLHLMATHLGKEDYSNSTRMRRGSYWAQSNSVYNLVASLKSRQSDVKTFPYHKAYIWGKKLGIKKANLQVAAGGFIGAAKDGQYKIFGRAKAVGQLFKKKKTLLDFLVLREKRTRTTRTRLFAQIAGKTLANIDIRSRSTVCKKYRKNLFRSNKYLVFDFRYPIRIVIATLRVGVAGYVRLSSNLFVEFCERVGSLSAEAGLESTITLEVKAGVTGSLLKLARGGVTVSGVFNYRITPSLTTEVCLTNFKIRVKNCIGVYHQWTNNKILFDVWYQFKKCKRKWAIFPFCKTKWRSVKKIKKLSKTWNLPSTAKKPLWRKCDRNFVCTAATTKKPVVRRPPGRPGVRGRPGVKGGYPRLRMKTG